VAPNLVLAPMSGITDSAYRSLVKDLNPGAVGLVVTELVSIEGLARQDLRTHRMLRHRPREHPLVIQLFGSDPERMAEAAAIAEGLGADVVDVNCGCPVPKVVKKGGGAELMRQAPVLAAILRALRRVLSIPYTVKIRAGWDDGSRNAVEIARLAEGEGAALIAVHGRTRAQLYTGRSDWELIAAVKDAVSVPVVGSGDVEHAAGALERLRTTGVDGVMIGRGTLGHPWIFREIAALRAGLVPQAVTLGERLAAIDMLLDRLARDLTPESALGRARGLACRMIKFVRGGAALRESLTKAPSIADMRALLARAAEAAENDASDAADVATVRGADPFAPAGDAARRLVYTQTP
jgi:nifR3 family TIM-barrel protein